MYSEERNPFFSVRKEQIKTISSDITLDKVALINDETDNVLGIVSPNYEVVTNDTINDLFDEAIADLSVKEVQDHMDADTKRWKRRIMFDNDDLNFDISNGDVVGIMLEIHNGFTGRTSFGYHLLGYRWACSNGMVMGRKNLFSESYGHYVHNPAKLRESFGMKFDLFRNTADTWKQWTQEPFTFDQFKEFVLDDQKKYIGEKIGQTIVDAWEPALVDQGLDETKWGAFNVLTWLASHQTKARNGSNLFSNRFGNIERLAADMYHMDERLAV